MDNNSSQDFSLPKDFDIEEVTSSSEEEKTVIVAGDVKAWKRIEAIEKAKTRAYITGIVITLWVICTVAGILRWATLGDISLLISSPVLLIGPVGRVLKFYFSE